jgi:NAD(P)-dependent dehydrogenase (short-subunit alcohol dehydrogenase family)
MEMSHYNRMMIHGKHAVISGSTRGIGLALAEAIVKAGGKVTLNCAHNHDRGLLVAQELGALGQVFLVPADATVESGATALIQQAVDRFGAIDILVNNVGWILHSPWHLYTNQEWDWHMDRNLKSAWLCSKAAFPWFAEGSSILNVASSSAFSLELDALPYSIAKAGLLTLTKGLARILAPRTRVNAIAPGYVETTFDKQDQQQAELITPLIPLGRFAHPAEVAQAAIILLVNEYITGEILTIDGGESLR